MSKRRTKFDEIKNPENYYDLVRLLREMFVGEDGSAKTVNRLLLADNLNDEEFEKYISESSMFGWIEMIENKALYEVVSQLSEIDKIILTLRYQFCLPQSEIAKAIGISQGATCRRETRIVKK